jgi:hypothetical protein
MSDAAPPEPTLEVMLPSTESRDDSNLKLAEDVPIEIVHLILMSLAMLGGQHTVTAMLVCKELASKLSPYVYNGSLVHWINLTDFMAALKRDNIQELEHLTIDLRQESEKYMLEEVLNAIIPHVPHVPHPERLPNPEKDRKRYDCDGPSNALSECNFRVKHLRVINLYERMNFNKGLNKDFASSIQTLTCLENEQTTAQDVLRYYDWLRSKNCDLWLDFESKVREVIDLPNCQFLLLEPSRITKYVGKGRPMFNLTALDYVYILFNDSATYSDFEKVRLMGVLNVIRDDTKVAVVIQYHTERPPLDLLEYTDDLGSQVPRESRCKNPKMIETIEE